MSNRIALSVLLPLAGAVVVLAHPHFNKTVVAQLPGGVEARIAYRTIPCNQLRLEEVPLGTFVTPRAPRLTLSGRLRAGTVPLAGGEYTIGVIKKGADDWLMALCPGRVRVGETPDASRLVRLASRFVRAADAVEHIVLDISPGEGTFKGRAVVTIRFGAFRLEGALDYPDGPVPPPDKTPGAIHGHP